MLRSTFLGYKTATSALTVSQNQMDIVGHRGKPVQRFFP
ncbi:MAG: hypothetical protein K0Q47_1039 [Sedimentibacter sp.]|nr:hypothetical protein [Sedimentibacter sp.]